jgi:hypothetical protein
MAPFVRLLQVDGAFRLIFHAGSATPQSHRCPFHFHFHLHCTCVIFGCYFFLIHTNTREVSSATSFPLVHFSALCTCPSSSRILPLIAHFPFFFCSNLDIFPSNALIHQLQPHLSCTIIIVKASLEYDSFSPSFSHQSRLKSELLQSQAVCVDLSTMPNSQPPPAWNVFDLDVQPSVSLVYTTRISRTETKVFQLSAGTTQRIRKRSALLKEYNKLYVLEERFRWSSRQWLISPTIVVSRRRA